MRRAESCQGGGGTHGTHPDQRIFSEHPIWHLRLGFPDHLDELVQLFRAQLLVVNGSQQHRHPRQDIRIGQDPLRYPSDANVLSRMPMLLRTVHNKQLSPEQLDKLIEMIREA